MPRGIYPRTEFHRAIISAASAGRRHSDETRAKMSAAKKGRRPKNFEAALARAHATPKPKGAENPNWKGDAVGYGALHSWLRRTAGAPSRCERCGTTSAKRFEWANKSRTYQRDLSDWERLCVSCHRKDGFAKQEYIAWRKGKKTGFVPRSAFRPGERRSPRTEFKPGLTPWNKRLTVRPCVHCGRPFQPKDATRKFCRIECYWRR